MNMATLSLRISPPIRPRTFRPIAASSSNGAPLSKFRSTGGPVVMEIPLENIRRPLMRTRANDPDKVKELMDSIQAIGLQVPIDVLEVDKLMEYTMAFQVVTGMRRISDSAFQPSIGRCGVVRKKH